jgi:hypothetical protein
MHSPSVQYVKILRLKIFTRLREPDLILPYNVHHVYAFEVPCRSSSQAVQVSATHCQPVRFHTAQEFPHPEISAHQAAAGVAGRVMKPHNAQVSTMYLDIVGLHILFRCSFEAEDNTFQLFHSVSLHFTLHRRFV